MTRILLTTGDGEFIERDWELPACQENQITVKSIMTGVCRSDIDMMLGDFGPLPVHMQGHEGLGRVTHVGTQVTTCVQVGDFVATRGEPAYADVYHVRDLEFVVVPEALPKYILEPVACGINVIKQADRELAERKGNCLILGSGFLAWVAYNTLILDRYHYDVTVVGSSNTELWGNLLHKKATDRYDVVIDLSGNYRLGTDIFLNDNALIIDAVGKEVSNEEAKLQLWSACTTIKPSPRNSNFIKCMRYAAQWVENKQLIVDSFWTKAYSRDTEWKQAFADGANRPENYSRGYIKWD